MADANSPGSPPSSVPDHGGSVHALLESECTRLILSGEIDLSLNADLTEAVADAEAAGLPVQVDTRHVTFMDSSGIALLARLASRTPGRLTMIKPPDVVRFLLEVTRIGEMVDVVDTDEPAPAATNSAAPPPEPA
ncbi:anti-sigma factor antagonist [Occultella glacieicola]|uniref:Anti-sigma factor antagonist n=1 Tax=Occultella glacieicola TaxID=2518684 RepID=A0ABY2EBF0_9MICO|nr:STAS domain-containing protein [Occultella glacieicola]TDE99103.1 anti-sigma factor antagonist [Occultella glacieicola]